MSSRSASVYETSTETLFLGRQDAMQRMTLVPMRAGAEEVAREGRGEGRIVRAILTLQAMSPWGPQMHNYNTLTFTTKQRDSSATLSFSRSDGRAGGRLRHGSFRDFRP